MAYTPTDPAQLDIATFDSVGAWTWTAPDEPGQGELSEVHFYVRPPRGATTAQGLLTVEPGEDITLYVGGRPDPVTGAGGFGGGGDGYVPFGDPTYLTGGDGASDVRQGGDELVDRAIVAGALGGRAMFDGTPLSISAPAIYERAWRPGVAPLGTTIGPGATGQPAPDDTYVTVARSAGTDGQGGHSPAAALVVTDVENVDYATNTGGTPMDWTLFVPGGGGGLVGGDSGAVTEVPGNISPYSGSAPAPGAAYDLRHAVCGAGAGTSLDPGGTLGIDHPDFAGIVAAHDYTTAGLVIVQWAIRPRRWFVGSIGRPAS